MTEKDTDERPNALLTKKDREWLAADEPLYTGPSAAQQRYRRRKSIRTRAMATLQDFSLLLDQYPAADPARLVADLAGDDTKSELSGPRTPPRVVGDALGFLYLLHGSIEDFENTVEYGLISGTKAKDETEHKLITATADLEIDTLDFPDFDEIYEMVAEGDIGELSSPDRAWIFELLYSTGELTDALDDVRERVDDPVEFMEERARAAREAHQDDDPD